MVRAGSAFLVVFSHFLLDNSSTRQTALPKLVSVIPYICIFFVNENKFRI